MTGASGPRFDESLSSVVQRWWSCSAATASVGLAIMVLRALRTCRTKLHLAESV